MDNYAQMKRSNHDLRIQIYMYALMYVDLETIPYEGYFTATKILLQTTRKFKLQY